MGYKSIGKQLQSAREEAGLNQEQLAAKIGCSQSTLSNYEKGKRRIYLAQLEKIAEVLNKPVHYFLHSLDYESAGEQVTGTTAPVQSSTARDDSHGFPALWQSLSPEGQQLVMDFAIWIKKREEGGNG